VQQAGCWALQNSALTAENRVAIPAKGGLEAVVRAMGAHGSSAGVQQAGCSALMNLAARNAENKVAIAAKGGIEAVVEAMKVHDSSAEVQEAGCWALENIASWGSGLHSEVRGADAVPFVKKALSAFPYKWAIQVHGRVLLIKLRTFPFW